MKVWTIAATIAVHSTQTLSDQSGGWIDAPRPEDETCISGEGLTEPVKDTSHPHVHAKVIESCE